MGDWKITDAGLVIPVLTVDPIWAWAIMWANKRIENRSWTTEYRGPVWVHAGATQRASKYEDAAVTIRAHIRRTPLMIPSPARLPLSQVLGLMMLEGSEVAPFEVSRCEPWENASERGGGPSGSRPLNHGWRISVLHRLERPITRLTGQLGFWKLPAEASARMDTRVQRLAREALRLARVKGKGDGRSSG